MAPWSPHPSMSPDSTASRRHDLPSCCEIPQGPYTVVIPRVLPRNRRQTGSRLAPLMTTSCGASCACAQMREELEARRQSAPLFPAMARGVDKRTQTWASSQFCYRIGRRGQAMSLQEAGRVQGSAQSSAAIWEPRGSREQLGPGPSCFRAEGAQGEGMGSELKLDSPMKLMGGQILP